MRDARKRLRMSRGVVRVMIAEFMKGRGANLVLLTEKGPRSRRKFP